MDFSQNRHHLTPGLPYGMVAPKTRWLNACGAGITVDLRSDDKAVRRKFLLMDSEKLAGTFGKDLALEIIAHHQ